MATSTISMRRARPQRRDREGHRDAMIAVAVDAYRRRSRPPRAATGHPAAAGVSTPSTARPAAMAARRSLSLTRSSCGAAHHGLPARTGGGDEEHRELIDRQRHQRLGDARCRAARSRAPRCRRPARRPRLAPPARCTRMSAPMRCSMLEQAGARRVDADVADQRAARSPPGTPATMKNAAEEKSAGTASCVPRAGPGRPRARSWRRRAARSHAEGCAACARCDRARAQAR